MDVATYRSLLAQARRHSRRADEAQDLVQQTLLAGLEAGRDDPAWLAGTLRNLAALAARSSARRRRREHAASDDPDVGSPAPEPLPASPLPLLAALPPAARRVAVLALHGLSADEIRWILDIPDTAFRQRLSRIRKALGELPPAQRAEAKAMAYVRDPARSVELQFGLVRRALQAVVGLRPGLGTHDADGHLLVIHRPAHKSGPGGNDQVG
ncbi:RNA polymerase sigma factor [Arenimonas aestuarii]